jgi:hypothetical protein
VIASLTEVEGDQRVMHLHAVADLGDLSSKSAGELAQLYRETIAVRRAKALPKPPNK